MYRRPLALVSLLSLLLLAPWSSAKPLTLIYSANLDGELEPCGCSAEGDYGGIKRRATYLDQSREALPELVVISGGGLFSSELGGDPIKDRFIASGMAQLNYDALGIQWADLLHGTELLTQEPLPLTAVNWKDDTFAKAQRFEKQGVSIFFTQWLDPAKSPYQAMQGAEEPIDASSDTLHKLLQEARDAGQLTIVGTTLPLDKAQSLLPLALIDILLIESAYEHYGEPQRIGETLVLQPGSRGMRLGRLELTLTDNNRIRDFSHQVVELGVGVPDAPRLAEWYDAYNQALKEDYEWRVAQRKKIRSGQSPYAGEQVCATCHADQHAKWEETRHANAFATLERVNKAFDPNCLACHTVGFMQEGGYLDLSLTGQLTNVQCENCHGAAAEHASSGGQVKPANADWQPEQICAQCHNHSHSPAFDFDSYWPKIQHARPATP